VTQAVKINVLLVEDSRLMFEGLLSLLGEYPDVSVVGVATTVADAVEKASLLKPDLILMDFRLPDGDGVQAAERIRRNLPDTAIVFLSAESSEAAMVRAVQAGASGFVSKGATADELITAVRMAAEGERLLEAATMARLSAGGAALDAEGPHADRPTAPLSSREREVLALMVRGMDNTDIAGELGVTAGAVRGHVRSTLEKLGANTRVQAIAAARRAGLLDG
jgi:DNA-binding NarL/FixJ family response regulator